MDSGIVVVVGCCCWLLLLLFVVVVVGSGVQQIWWMIKEWAMLLLLMMMVMRSHEWIWDADICWSYVHLVSSLIHSNPSSTETRNLLPYVMVCITVKKTSRQSVLLVFSVITRAERALVFIDRLCNSFARSAGYFYTAENELSEVDIMTN